MFEPEPTGHLEYTTDELGKELLLKDGDLQVMMEWEKPYMIACIDELKPHGDVLEIGFGLGYSANQIQSYKPKNHTIIESDPAAIAVAKEWAKRRPGVKIIEGTWQDQLGKLGVFDTVFFDDYTPLSKEDVEGIQKDSEKSKAISEEIQSLKDSIADQLYEFSHIKFSDQDVRNFISQSLDRPNIQADSVSEFLNRLELQGNITAIQNDRFQLEIEKLTKTKKPPTDRPGLESEWLNKITATQDRFIFFTEACLDKHMRKGSRLSAYMDSPETKKNNAEFKNKILTRKDVKYSEKTMQVEVPANCHYYKGNKALIIIIEKK